MASVDDEDSYTEDECTMEFGEEEELPVAEPPPIRYPMSGVVGGPVFMDYPGEDFSKYLSDTPDDNNEHNQPEQVEQQQGSISSRTRRRYIKNTNNIINNNNNKASIGRSRFRQPSSNAPSQPQSPPNPTPEHIYDLIDPLDVEPVKTPVSPNPVNSPPIIIPPPASPMTRRKPLNVIRERVGRIFTTAQSGRRTRSKSSERPALQNFTFADSKIGSMMLAQLERDRAAKGHDSSDFPPETQSDLGVTGTETWWDVGSLSSNRSLRLKDGTKSNLFRRRRDGRSNSVPNLAQDERAETGKRDRRNSDVVYPSPPSTPTAPSSGQPTSAPSTTAAPPPSINSSDKSDGRGTKRGNVFKWLKEGVGSVRGTSRRMSEGDNNVASGPTYTRIYEEMNKLTNDFRQSTVDNPLP